MKIVHLKLGEATEKTEILLYFMISSCRLEQRRRLLWGSSDNVETPQGKARGGSRSPHGKRSHLRKSTAVSDQKVKSKTFLVGSFGEGDITLAENRNYSNLRYYHSTMSSYFFIRTKSLPIRLAIASSAKFQQRGTSSSSYYAGYGNTVLGQSE